MPLLHTRGVRAGYNGRVVVTLPDLEVSAGDRVVISGPNGCGKTTALKTLAHLLPAVEGTVAGPGPGVGGAVYVHPSPFLFAGSGEHNVLLGAHGDASAARDALDALKAQPFAHLDIRKMSNGQRQRIALARALAAKPRLLLIDEADSGLDADGRRAWDRLLADRREFAVILATHDLRIQKTEFRTLSLQAAP